MGGCGRQNNDLLKDVHILVPRTYKYVYYITMGNSYCWSADLEIRRLSCITWVDQHYYKGGEERHGRECQTQKFEDAALLTLKKEGRGHKPRSADSLQKLQRAREWILPWSLQKESSPADTLVLAQ